VQPLKTDAINLYDQKITSLLEQVDFGDTLENMVIDAPKSVINVSDDLDFVGEVRLKALDANVDHKITANHIRVESKSTVSIAVG
jgi:hypothetical protein